MQTTTATRTRHAPGAAIVAARNLAQELEDLYALQNQWLDAMQRTDDAIDLLLALGYTVAEPVNRITGSKRAWCWKDSPHAARICAIEREMGV